MPDADSLAVIARLRSSIPGLPDDFEERLQEPLKAVLEHSVLQALIFFCQTRSPSVPREAFEATTTGNDVVYWLQNSDLVTGDTDDASRVVRGTYRSATVALRPIEEADVLLLYRASLEPSKAHRWRYRGETPSLDMFRQTLFTHLVLAQYMVVPAESPFEPIGLVTGYSADLVGRHCSVAVQRLETERARRSGSAGLMVEGTLVFFEYLFDHFELRKLYLELPEYNLSLISGGAGRLLREEGVLKEHYWFGGRYWDKHIFSLFRSDWEAVAGLYRGEWPDGRENDFQLAP